MKKLIAPIILIFLLISGNPTAVKAMPDAPQKKLATFAGGCFWCIQPVFEGLEGVTKTTVGYSGGTAESATYETVSGGRTEHREAIQIEFDPARISFETLLEKFMYNIDPTDPAGQFADKGKHYQTAIYYHDEGQKVQAEAYFKKLKDEMKFKYPIYTEITAYSSFYPAEEYHQKYSEKNLERYNAYKYGSGRPQKLKQIWQEPK